LSTQSPVLLAWGRNTILDVAVEGQTPNRVSNVLYYVPLSMGVHGAVTFSGDLITSTMTESDAAFFSKDPSTMTFGQGTATVVYRPIAFEGKLAVEHLRLGLSFGPDGTIRDAGGAVVVPIPDACLAADPKKRPAECPKPQPAEQFDGVPEVELFDR